MRRKPVVAKKTAMQALSALAGALALTAGAVEVDGIAARVGTETILKSDVAMEMQRLRAPASSYDEVRAGMIDRKLILRAASEAKMSMQDWIVENRIRDIVDRAFGGDRNKLMEALSKQKVSYPEWHARMREDMIIQAMRWNVVDKNATASPAAMREEFNAHPEKYSTPPKVTVSVILRRSATRSPRCPRAPSATGSSWTAGASSCARTTRHPAAPAPSPRRTPTWRRTCARPSR